MTEERKFIFTLDSRVTVSRAEGRNWREEELNWDIRGEEVVGPSLTNQTINQPVMN